MTKSCCIIHCLINCIDMINHVILCNCFVLQSCRNKILPHVMHRNLPTDRTNSQHYYTLLDINHWMYVDISHQTDSTGKPTLNWLATTSSQGKKKVKRMWIAHITLASGKSFQCGFFPLESVWWELSTFIQWLFLRVYCKHILLTDQHRIIINVAAMGSVHYLWLGGGRNSRGVSIFGLKI